MKNPGKENVKGVVANPVEAARSAVERLLTSKKLKLMVSEEEQQIEIEQLKHTISHERFFLVMDLRVSQFKHVHGVQRWLGYPDKNFTLEKFTELIHPSQKVARNMMALSLLELTVSGKFPLRFLVQRFVSQVALRHSNGKYLLFNRISMPFQYTDKNQMLEYLSEYTLLGQYKDTPYSLRTADAAGNELDWHKDIVSRLQQMFSKLEAFSVQEWRILRRYAYSPRITHSAVAKSFKIKEATVKEYNNRIKAKATVLFSKEFLSAREVATFLREQNLL